MTIDDQGYTFMGSDSVYLTDLLLNLKYEPMNIFEDTTKQLRETMLGIRAKYGKNSILKGINYTPAATGRERNAQIGEHRSQRKET